MLMLRGYYPEATKQYLSAHQLARGPLLQAKIDAKLGELTFKQGDMKSTSEYLGRGLGYLGKTVPEVSVVSYTRDLGNSNPNSTFHFSKNFSCKKKTRSKI